MNSEIAKLSLVEALIIWECEQGGTADKCSILEVSELNNISQPF